MIHAENKHKGFTLIELLCAVAVLGVVILPLMRSFVIGAETTVKSSDYGSATQVMENVLEAVEANKPENLKKNLDIFDINGDAIGTVIDATGPIPDIIEYTIDFGDNLFADLVLDSTSVSTELLSINDIGAASAPKIHSISLQSYGPTLNPDYVAYKKFESFLDTLDSATVSTNNLKSGERRLNVIITGDPSRIGITVRYDYQFEYTTSTLDGAGNVTSTSATLTNLQTSGAISFTSSIPDDGSEVFGLVVSYFPFYELDETILVSNRAKDNGEVLQANVLLNKQLLVEYESAPGKTPMGYTANQGESGYDCKVILHESYTGTTTGAEPILTSVRTNMKENLATVTPLPPGSFTQYYTTNELFDWTTFETNPGAYAYTGDFLEEMVTMDDYNRVYDVTVNLYSFDSRGNREELLEIETIKLA
ncbi:MAG: prepilin-type N-terminal cleavage/methylation domain-containing protein [Eubacteriales bacterium]